MNLARLNQGECFEEFVERSKPPENDEGVAVFYEHHLAHKEVLNFNDSVRY